MITMLALGDPDRAERALAPLRSFGRPLLDLVALRHYTGLQSIVDPTVPHGWNYYWKAASIVALDDSIVDALIEHSS
jgi:hypothetical protein